MGARLTYFVCRPPLSLSLPPLSLSTSRGRGTLAVETPPAPLLLAVAVSPPADTLMLELDCLSPQRDGRTPEGRTPVRYSAGVIGAGTLAGAAAEGRGKPDGPAARVSV
jgi:hypothetical protein